MHKKQKRIFLWVLAGVAGIILLAFLTAIIIYPPEYVFRVITWGNSDSFDWQKFPNHPLDAAPVAYEFTQDTDRSISPLFAELARVNNWEEFLSENQTQAFIIIKDGVVVYEAYFNGTQRDSIVTSFSVAKSFTSALIGIAIDEGAIKSVNDPITDYLPELATRDARFKDITIKDVLRMSSGLEYEENRVFGLNGDDALSTYFPDQRFISLNNTHIVDPPGKYFLYNKYHPQLLGMIIERATGRSVTEFMQQRLWNLLGMEFNGSWSTDSEESDFEKMETGINARAIDFAKFGQLFLNNGEWNNKQVISEEWITESTKPYLPSEYSVYYPSDWFSGLPGEGYYQYMWWGNANDDGSYDFAAAGDRGQFIYVAPRNGLVIIRNGIDYGITFDTWFDLFHRFTDEY